MKRVFTFILIIVLVATASIFLFFKEEPAPPFGDQTADTVARNYFGGCDIGTSTLHDRCTLSATYRQEGKKIIVVATYSGLQDDSIAAERYEGEARYSLGEWSVSDYETRITVKCQPGRGHQDFSQEPCI